MQAMQGGSFEPSLITIINLMKVKSDYKSVEMVMLSLDIEAVPSVLSPSGYD